MMRTDWEGGGTVKEMIRFQDAQRLLSVYV